MWSEQAPDQEDILEKGILTEFRLLRCHVNIYFYIIYIYCYIERRWRREVLSFRKTQA